MRHRRRPALATLAKAPADHPERQYLGLLSDILENGVRRGDRTGGTGGGDGSSGYGSMVMLAPRVVADQAESLVPPGLPRQRRRTLSFSC